ncbi:hypothetical protein [Kaarinaea lacus]
MGNETLRQLARDYAIGHINKYDYRHKRSQLIDEITAIHFDQGEDPSPVDSVEEPPNQARFHPTNTHPEYINNQQSQASKYRVIFIAVAILAIVIVFITMKTSGNSDTPVAIKSSSVKPETAELLVAHFINYDEWTSERVSEFVAGWQRLTDIEKQQAHKTEWFKNLINTLKIRLAQQKTLAKAGSEQAELNVQTINSLGRLLSVSL